MDGSSNFLTYGAPLARASRARELRYNTWYKSYVNRILVTKEKMCGKKNSCKAWTKRKFFDNWKKMEASLQCVWNRQNAKSSDLISSLALACSPANYELCRSWKVKNKTSDVRLQLHLCRRARNTKLIAFSLKVKQDMNSLLDLCNSHCREYKSQESFVVYATALRALAPRKRFPPNGVWCRWKMKRFATALVIAENTFWQNLSGETKLSLRRLKTLCV